ncbi:MAG: hypothetical protein WC841_04075 [Candidatus Shapirobacteria bacterium]|jgi:hypothetical protein
MINFQLVKPAYAVICNKLLNPDCGSSVQVSDPIGYFDRIVRGILSVFMLVAVLYFIWHFLMGSYHYIDSSGDPKKIEEAQKQLTYALVGLIASFSVFAILKVIGIVFGITSLQTLSLPVPTL